MTIKEKLKPTVKKRSACEAGAQEAPTGFCCLVLCPEGPLPAAAGTGISAHSGSRGAGWLPPAQALPPVGSGGSSGVKGGAPWLRQQGQADGERGSWAGTVSGPQSLSTVPLGSVNEERTRAAPLRMTQPTGRLLSSPPPHPQPHSQTLGQLQGRALLRVPARLRSPRAEGKRPCLPVRGFNAQVCECPRELP